MYNFYFGEKETIDKYPERFLLAIKRMLPRWCNSIPDSEFLAIYDILGAMELPDAPVFVETGSGASTIMLSYFALKTGGQLYSWDINGNKLSYLRSVMNETLMNHFLDKNLNEHWNDVAFSSNSEFAGINMLEEKSLEISFAFFDSEHVWMTLGKELESVCGILKKPAVIAIDDGNYNYREHNLSYINMIRKKNKLPEVPEDPKNICGTFWEETYKHLKEKFNKVEYLEDSYKKNYQKDLFWSYFNADRENMADLNMEKTSDLEHRFDAWKVIE